MFGLAADSAPLATEMEGKASKEDTGAFNFNKDEKGKEEG